LRETLPEEHEERLAVFDSGGYSEANMKRYNEAKIKWISRVPETSTVAKSALQEEPAEWYPFFDGSGLYTTRIMDFPQGKERWVIVRTRAGEQRAREQMVKQVKKSQEQWEKRLWHLANQKFSSENDAQQAWKQAMKRKPSFLVATFTLQAEHVLRRQLTAASQTVPNQVNKPTDRPTMRWIFQCFEGIDLLHIHLEARWQTQILGLQPLHQRILRLLGSAYCQCYFLSP
jgi:transposase